MLKGSTERLAETETRATGTGISLVSPDTPAVSKGGFRGPEGFSAVNSLFVTLKTCSQSVGRKLVMHTEERDIWSGFSGILVMGLVLNIFILSLTIGD